MGKVNDTKQRLLDAAHQLLWDESLAAASVDAICDKAGVKKGSFYHFFKSKEDLVAAALEAKFQSVRPELDRIFSSSVAPLDRLRKICDFLYQMQKQKLEQAGRVVGCPYASVGGSCSTEDGTIQGKTRDIMATQLKYLETAIRDGQADGSIPGKDARGAAEAVFDFIEGAMTAARIRNDLKPVENLARGVFAMLGLPGDPLPVPAKVKTRARARA